MNKWKIRLNRAVSNLPHPEVDDLWNKPVCPMAEHDWITQQDMPTTHRRIPAFPVRRLAVSMACLALVFIAGLLWYNQTQTAAAVISLDVNPGMEITINHSHHVLMVEGRNAEAEKLLDGCNYRGLAVEDAIETLTRRLIERNYFHSGMENAVLLSVGMDQQGESEQLAQRLSRCIREAADNTQTPTTVLRQSYTRDEVRADEPAANMTEGKQRLLNTLTGVSDVYTVDDLQTLSVEALEEMILPLDDAIQELSVDRSVWLVDQDATDIDATDSDQTDVETDNASNEQTSLPSSPADSQAQHSSSRNAVSHAYNHEYDHAGDDDTDTDSDDEEDHDDDDHDLDDDDDYDLDNDDD